MIFCNPPAYIPIFLFYIAKEHLYLSSKQVSGKNSPKHPENLEEVVFEAFSEVINRISSRSVGQNGQF